LPEPESQQLKFTLQGKHAYAARAPMRLDPTCDSVIFVHGTGQDHSIWAMYSQYFGKRARNVLAVDLPGHGRSEGPALATVESMADWIADLICTAGLGKAAIVGHSLGSLIALDCAARHGELVRAIGLVGTCIPMPVNDALLKAAREDPATAIQMMTKWSFARAEAGSPQAARISDMQAASARLMAQSPPGVIFSDLKACDAYASGLQRAREVSCPAVLILGEHDRMTPAHAAGPLASAIKQSRVVTIRDAGHGMLAEQPEQLLSALDAFV